MAMPETADRSGREAVFRLPYWAWYFAWVGGCTAALTLWHARVYNGFNGWQFLLSLFLAINIITCVQEICLGLCIGEIERWHHDPDARNERPRGSMWMTKVSPCELASATFWARLWYEYAYFDPGYADRRSFGFSIDVGNGWWTLVPSVVFLVGMTKPILSPVALGVLGALLFYQKLYCTGLYFFQYIFNRYYEKQPIARVLPVVGGSNGVWLVFPVLGLIVSVRLIFSASFGILR
jgi:hypothetical protein